jgi:UDP-N-acetylglucosamine/UDP-N-acetylgalactosamine diphosphorylase
MPVNPDPDLVERVARHGQQGLFRFWAELKPEEQSELVRQVRQIDFDQLDHLIRSFVRGESPSDTQVPIERVRSVEVNRLPQTDGERVARRVVAEEGERALAQGEVAVVIVAGGSGTRLGYDGPKGTYPIGAVSAASLFQIHCEKVVALGRKYGRPLPLYIMTSPENNDATISFFAEHDNFGVDHVRFFVQGQMPAVDRASGEILLAEKGSIALSPDGHGGTFAALAAPGAAGGPSCLQEMRAKGVRTIFYFQVDNPLVRVADPAFLGFHRTSDAEMSFKVIEKVAPDERVGVVVQVDGKPQVIEYSDLPEVLAERREPEGGLELWAGSIAIHLIELDFIDRLVSGEAPLPFHRAIKKVPFIDPDGNHIEPSQANAVKFERFIFDALPLARRWSLMETDRAVEFEPLKNATGPDSPESVRRRMTELFATWLEAAGATIQRDINGSIPFPIEISPLYALSGTDLKSKGKAAGLVIDGPIYLV